MDYKELNSQVMIKKDGFYQIDKDKLALEKYLKHIGKNSIKTEDRRERFEEIVKMGLYQEDLLSRHSEEFLGELFSLCHSLEFKFQSFMSAFKFFNDYALKHPVDGMILEGFKDRCLAITLSLFDSITDAKDFLSALIKQEYQPATPTFFNVGKKYRGESISCFLLDTQDSLDSIVDVIGNSMKLSKIGGGVAINLSNLRAKGEPINKNPNACKGVVPVAKILEESFNYADQMGQRKGAGVVYLNVFHRDIIEFLDTKKINADAKIRLQTLSQGVIVPSLFFDLIRDGSPIFLFSSYNLQKCGYCKEGFPEITRELYEKMITDDRVVKYEHDARKILLQIAKTQFESGYPYLVYIDNANKVHNNVGRVKMSNLCTEIFQEQFFAGEEVIFRDKKIVADKDYNVSCVLGSLNIVNVMENIHDFEKTVFSAVKSLSKIADSYPKYIDSIYMANKDFKSIGIGAMNLYGFFIKNHINYESDEAIEFCKVFFMLLNYYSLMASNAMAKKHRKTYKYFEYSKYADGTYFDEYSQHTITREEIKHERISNMFDFIPSREDWEKLKESVMQYGLYNAYRLTIAPTQSISYVQNSTPSIFPPVDVVEVRTYGNSTTCYPAPFLSPENQVFYKNSYRTNITKMIDLVSEVQKHIDQGISTTLFVNSNTSTKELMKYYIYAHKVGLKSLYYTRTKNLTIEECESCAI